MKFYHFPISPNSRRVSLAAAQLGISFDENQLVDIAKGEQKSPEYLAVNPNGLVPSLVDGDTTLWESRGIIQYLASKKPGSGLLGGDETGRADVTRWLCWDAGHLAPEIFTMVFETMLKGLLGLGDGNMDAVKAAAEQVNRYLGVMDASLNGSQYLVGDALTIADLSIASTLTYADELGLPMDDFPSVKGWFDNIRALDAWTSTQPQLPA